MKVLITGGNGMLGRTLQRRLSQHDLVIGSRSAWDVTQANAFRENLGHLRPDVVIHAAAMTAVDLCQEQTDEAYRVNAIGSANVAAACHAVGSRLIAISTDYVFDGGLDRPYHEWDLPAPKTVYGASKLAGESAIRSHCPDHVIVRTAWLYGPGGPSFVHTMRRLASTEGPAVKVVQDQIGNPTSTDALAGLLQHLLEQPVVGTVHGTCEGEASWYDFARTIFTRLGSSRPCLPCTTAEFPRPAPRPANSRLDKRAIRLHGLPPMPDWRDALDRFCEDFPDG